MFHSLRFLRSQLMLPSEHRYAPRLAADLAATPLGTPAARAAALSRACGAVCQFHGLSPRLEGELPSEPVIFVSNHLGYVDPVAICSLVPCCPIAKSEVAAWPVIGGLARRMGVLFVRRGDPTSGMRVLREAKRRLEAGISILNFPEGTTTTGATREFQRGAFGLSMLTGRPVVPLALWFEDPALCWVDDEGLLPHYATSMIGKQHRVELRVGAPMVADGGESAERFASRTRAWIDAALAGRREPAAPLPVRPRPVVGAVPC